MNKVSLTDHQLHLIDITLRKRLVNIQFELDDPIESEFYLRDLRKEKSDIMGILAEVPEFSRLTSEYQRIYEFLSDEQLSFDFGDADIPHKGVDN